MSPKRSAPLTGKIAQAVMGVAGALDGLPSPGMLIGGIAVILQGIPRMTRDVDATVEATSMDLDALALHFERHGIVPRIDDARAFARASQVLLLRHRQSGVDVDLSLAWLPFELEAIAAREAVSSHPLRTQIARPEDLVIYKAIAWRPQDQQDVERLLTLHGQRMDLTRVRTRVAELAAAIDADDRLEQLEQLIARTMPRRS
jgi:hypothetical protein